MLGLAVPVCDFNAHAHYRPAPAIHRQVAVAEVGPLPCFGGSGTGGVESVHFVMSRQGYSPYAILKFELSTAQDTYAPYTDLMKEVKAGFGRTMSHLPAVFGVSRQTRYNWLSGETPKEQPKASSYSWPLPHVYSPRPVSNQPRCRLIVPLRRASRSLNLLDKVPTARKQPSD